MGNRKEAPQVTEPVLISSSWCPVLESRRFQADQIAPATSLPAPGQCWLETQRFELSEDALANQKKSQGSEGEE